MTNNCLNTTHIADMPFNEFDTIVAIIISVKAKTVELQLLMKDFYGECIKILRPANFSAKEGQVVDLVRDVYKKRPIIKINRIIPANGGKQL